MRRLGFMLFVVGLVFLILSGVQRYLIDVMAEAKMIPGVEEAAPWFNVAIGASALVMVVGLGLRLTSRAPAKRTKLPPSAE